MSATEALQFRLDEIGLTAEETEPFVRAVLTFAADNQAVAASWTERRDVLRWLAPGEPGRSAFWVPDHRWGPRAVVAIADGLVTRAKSLPAFQARLRLPPATELDHQQRIGAAIGETARSDARRARANDLAVVEHAEYRRLLDACAEAAWSAIRAQRQKVKAERELPERCAIVRAKLAPDLLGACGTLRAMLEDWNRPGVARTRRDLPSGADVLDGLNRLEREANRALEIAARINIKQENAA